MYYWMGRVSGNLYEEEDRSKAFDNEVIIEAESEGCFWSAVERARGRCSRSTPFSKIEMGVKKGFLVADLIKFKGTPLAKVLIRGWYYIEIKIAKDVLIYVWIDRYGNCSRLEPFPLSSYWSSF